MLLTEKRQYIDFAIITAFIIIICRELLFTNGLPWGTDTLAWIARVPFLTKNYRWLYLWRTVSFGLIDQILLLDLFLGSLHILSGGSAALTINVFIFVTFLIAGFSMYKLTYYFIKQHNASLVASLIFILNQPFLSQFVGGHLTITLGYALAPLLFLLCSKALKVGKSKDVILFGVVLAVFISVSHPLSIYMFGSFLVLFVLSHALSFTHGIHSKKNVLKNLTKVSIISCFFVFLFLAFNLIPLLFGVRPTYFLTRYPIEDAYKYSCISLLDTFILKVSGGTLAELGYIIYSYTMQFEFPNPFTFPAVLFIPILAYSAIFFRRNRYTVFFTASAFLSAFIAKGPYPPFGEIFVWLYSNNVLGFAVFRAANRWSMMTVFSYSFLVSVSIDEISSRVMHNQTIASMKFPDTIIIKSILKRVIERYDLILVSLVMLGAVFSSWYSVFYGLQTYKPPESYTKPFEWISKQPGDFRVSTVPYGKVWIQHPDGLGIGHDFGVESFLYHDRPVVGIGGTNYLAQDFVGFTYRLVIDLGTDNAMKVLGAFNVKYFVAQEYSTFEERYFLAEQKGLQVIYTFEDSTVYENEFWAPHVFAVSKYAIVVGGREAFTALATFYSFNLSDWNLLFADQIADQMDVDQLLELINESPLLIFVNSEPLDLAMLTLENAIKIRAVDYAYPSTNKYEHWISDDWWTNMGMMVLNRRVLLTSGNLSLSIPVNVEESGEYDVWIRILYGESRGNLGVKIDGAELGSVLPFARHYSGLKWVKIGSAWLERGLRDLTLTNNKSTIEWAQGDSTNIDEILLVKPQEFEFAINKTTQLLQQSPARIVSIIEGEQMFKWATTLHFTDWWTARQPFNASMGWVASTTSENTWIPLEYSIFRNGRYSIALRMMVGPDQGTLRIIADDTEHLLNATSQELAFKWITLDPMTLQPGNHTVDLYGEGEVEIDQIAIYSLNQNEDEILLDDIFTTQKTQTRISYEKVNPTFYTVHVETDTSFFLVFSDAYHNLWKVYIDGEEIQSIPAYSFINTFQISETGEYDIVIEFIGQRYVVYGGIISIASITVTAIYLTFGVKITQFIVRKLKLKQKKEARENRVESM